LEHSVLVITKTLFQDIDQAEENFEENWEFAITEVIVNLEDKIKNKKNSIQNQLDDLDKFYVTVEQDNKLAVIKEQAFPSHKTGSFMSMSFDNGNLKRTAKSKRKSVKFEDESRKSKVDITEEMNFLKSINSELSQSENSNSMPTNPKEFNEESKYEKYLNSSNALQNKSVTNLISNKSQNFDFQELIASNNWVEDEMSLLLGLERHEQENDGINTFQEHENKEI
jgi:hypothetical protein